MTGSIDLGLVVDSDAFGGAEVYVRRLLRRLPGRFRRRLVVAGGFHDLAGVDLAVALSAEASAPADGRR